MTRHQVSNDKIEKGRQLWQQIDNAYLDARDSLFAKQRELVSKEDQGKDSSVSIIVNSDGSGLGNRNSRRDTGIVGIGHYLNIFNSNGRVKNTIPRYEYMIAPGTVKEAEIYASLQGVKAAKREADKLGADSIRLNLVTDSLGVIEMLHQIPNVLSEISNIEATPPRERSPFVWNKYREMKLVRELANELYNDDRVVSVNTRWVRAHMLDHIPYEDLKSVEVYINDRIKNAKGHEEGNEWREKKKQFHDMKNNKIVDEAASKASVKAVEARLRYFVCKHYLRKPNPDLVYQQEMMKTARDFSNSYRGARQHGIQYIATLEKGALKLNEIELLFGKDAYHEIAKERIKIAGRLDCKVDDIPTAIKSYFKDQAEQQRSVPRGTGQRFDTDFASMIMNQRLSASEDKQSKADISGP